MSKLISMTAAMTCLAITASAGNDTPHWSLTWKKMQTTGPELELIGTLPTRTTHELGASDWSVGCETLDRDYADFAEFMKGKKVPYESDTRRALKALKKAAEDDRFADLKNKFEQVEAELKDDTQTNLETYRTQVVETINNDIVMRHGYQAGVIEHSLSGDKEVKKAVEVLGDPAEYARITREQDTKRK